MTYVDKLICLTLALLGIVIHIFGVKIPSFKTRVTAANLVFSYAAYLEDDLAAIVASVAIILAALLLAPAAFLKYPLDTLYQYGIFLFLGFTDSSIIVAKMGKAEGKLNAIIDAKTNIADDMVPPGDSK